MKIELNLKYKSFDSPFKLELPSLTIITGLNGAGKTQLLTAINEGVIKLLADNKELNPKKYVTSTTLSPNNSAVITRQKLNQQIEKIWTKYNQLFKSNQAGLRRPSNQQLTNDEKRIIEDIAQSANKPFNKIEVDEFYRHYPIDDGLEKKDVFYQNFSSVFKRYYDKYLDNKFSKFLNEAEGHKEVIFLNEEDFSKSYGEAPWDFVNKIVDEANLDYHLNSPLGIDKDAPFELKLINKHTAAQIQFSDLSSGEKVIMSLALALYNSETDISFPKVLLMDEPDASLHPSMAKQFLDVIQNVFVNDKQTYVIITTHSPSTIALSPEDSIYVMNKTGIRLEKSSKDRALKILTAGVPAISINYENRKQVFVESKYDVFVYERIYSKLKVNLINEVSLNFISSGVDGSGNCDQVKEVVNKLSGYGNKSIFGIIDWDLKNCSNDFVKVLGEGKRYSIENYLFDSILLSALLLREKIVDRTDLGLKENENYTDFKSFNSQRLQSISDFVVAKVSTQLSGLSSDRQKIKYINNLEIEVPKWYLTIQGHELEQHIKNSFPQLKKYNKEGDLKKEVVSKVIDDIPELIPIDIYELLNDIQIN